MNSLNCCGLMGLSDSGVDFNRRTVTLCTPMVPRLGGMSGLGAAEFDYKNVSCADLEHRIGRLAANTRIKQPAYQANFKKFSAEYNTRCGQSQIPNPVGGQLPTQTPSSALPPGTDQVIGSIIGNILNPGGVNNLTPIAPPPPIEEPFYQSPWFKGAAVVGAAALVFGLWKMSRRK